MQTTDRKTTPRILIPIALWPLSITVSFIALERFLTTGHVSDLLTGAWALGVLAYWSFTMTGIRLTPPHLATKAHSRLQRALHVMLVAGALVYTLVFLLVALGPSA